MSTTRFGVGSAATALGVVAMVMAGLTLLFAVAVFATRLIPGLYPLALAGILVSIVTVPVSVILAVVALALGFAGRNGGGRLAARRGAALGALSITTLVIVLILQNMVGGYYT